MARTYLTPIDLSGLEILNVRAQMLASDPTNLEAKFYYNTVAKTIKFYNGAAWVSLGRLDQISAPTNSVDLNSQKIINLLDPTSAQDAATKNYVDMAITGLDFKQSARVIATSNITLSAPQTIDGVAVIANDRVLAAGQTIAANNGIYIVNAGAWTRATDADTTAEFGPNAFVFIEEGTVNQDSGWVMTSNATFTLGTTAQTWVQFTGTGQIVAGAGLFKTGNTIDVQAADGSITVNADNITVGLVTVAKGGTGATTVATARTALVVPGYFAASIGDGSATSYNIDHNLGTLDVIVDVYRVSDGATVECDIVRSTTNRVIVSFAVAPTTNQYRIICHG